MKNWLTVIHNMSQVIINIGKLNAPVNAIKAYKKFSLLQFMQGISMFVDFQ
jgi:hypothetical protein